MIGFSLWPLGTAIRIAAACLAILSSSPAADVARDSLLLRELAKRYDYAGLRGVDFRTSEGLARFLPGKKLHLEFRSAYALFPDDTVKYQIQDEYFTRRVFRSSPTDTGKVPGAIDFKSLLTPANCRIADDSLHADRKNLFIDNMLAEWFVLGWMPVVPIQKVSAQGWFDAKSLEIRHLDIEVLSPGSEPDHETYSLDLDRYRTVRGRLVPGRARYSLPGFSARQSDSSRTYLANSSPGNAEREKHILDLYQEELKKGNPQGAEKVKRAATRIETLRRRIAEKTVAGGPYYEVVLVENARGGKRP